MNRFCALVCVVLAALMVAVPAGARVVKPACPLSTGAPSGGDVQWAFTDSAPPSGGSVRSSYVHGRGSWTRGRATGTACTLDALRRGGGERSVVLAIRGAAKLTGHVTQGGRLGVRLVLPVKVSAASGRACAAGTTGSITLFASYYSVHRDAMRLALGSGCAGHDLSYGGSSLHVYIARHGAQVNALR